MSLKCQNCGKGVLYGHFVSHAKNRRKRVFKPNIKRVTIVKGKTKQRLVLCAKCVKAVKKKNFK